MVTSRASVYSSLDFDPERRKRGSNFQLHRGFASSSSHYPRDVYSDAIIRYDQGIAFGYGRMYDLDVLYAAVGETVVSAGRVQGRDAIFIKPRSRQGRGDSWIAWMEGDDMLVFKGTHVRFEVLRRAAESLPL